MGKEGYLELEEFWSSIHEQAITMGMHKDGWFGNSYTTMRKMHKESLIF